MMSNFKILLILQVLTLAAAIVGALAYFHKSANTQRGVIKGIVYNGVDSSVMIDNLILQEGDIIYGITIEKIHPKKVEFQKNGNCWTQKIGENPDTDWNESNKTQYSKKNK